MEDIDEELLEDLYTWVDQVPLSRPKKDIKRDFADGVQVAEIIKFYLPSYVEMHNYPSAFKTDRKLTNWNTLNRKVFKKLGFEIGDDVIRNISNCKPWAVEKFLMLLRRKIDRELYETSRKEKSRPPQHQQDYDPRTEVDRAYNKVKNAKSRVREYITGGRNSNQGNTSPSRAPGGGHQPMRKAESLQNLQRVGPGPTNYNSQYPDTGVHSPNRPPRGGGGGVPGGRAGVAGGVPGGNRDMVPKIVVEEKEQEILAKDETIQILQAKVRRLEHLLHLKDVRIDDLQHQIESINTKLRPTANHQYKR